MLGVASLLAAPEVVVVSTLGVLKDGEASFVSLSELLPPVCSGPFVSSFESVGVVPQVLGVASLLAMAEVGIVSTLGVLGDSETSCVSLSELPPALWSGRGWVRLSSHRYCGCRRLHMIVLRKASAARVSTGGCDGTT